ncbi:hypothetical protein M438DRAFT_345353 [Aureobasidium pullulans EXF-150]|uniref:Uncharacterized protein n=1 Tax=Aureobasidium pullulans EXF-150 TaxID=1043002 RepID=A0A074XT85_AURPU|nr:uncharacterized protein M438DRAFT_345353 [Aureobasidium pullulans EXF-150]KEQ85172.1 hypothetical protein M438DRAFT_345353 [Aureobasidium pullulans EXF-150]
MRMKARKLLHHPRSPQKRFRDREQICAKRYRSLGPFQDTVLARAWNRQGPPREGNCFLPWRVQNSGKVPPVLNDTWNIEYQDFPSEFQSNTLADQEIPGLDAMQTTNGRIFVSNKPNEDYEQDQQVSLHTRPMSR